MRKIKILSLFTGCGGLDLGFELANNKSEKYSIIWANDLYEHASETFAYNHKIPMYKEVDNYPNKPSIFAGDITKVNFRTHFSNKGAEIIVGGFPCQDFSLLRGDNNRNGITVKRGKLYMHFVRALIELQPKFFLAENVKGILSANKGLAFERITNDFENLNTVSKEIEQECGYSLDLNSVKGYHIIFKNLVDFSKLGIPQKRERVLIIGIRKDLINEKEAKTISEEFHKIKEDPIFSRYPLTTIELFYGKPLNKLKNEYKHIMKSYEPYFKDIDSKRKKEFLEKVWKKLSFDSEEDYFSFYGHPDNDSIRKTIFDVHQDLLNEMGFSQPISSLKFNNEPPSDSSSVVERMKHIPPGENHEFVKDTQFHVSGLMSNIYRRIHPLRPSPTIIALGGGGTWGYHFDITRQKLNNRERARIQTFPDDYQFKGKNGEIRTQIGNAVPPHGIKIFAKKLLKIYNKIVKTTNHNLTNYL